MQYIKYRVVYIQTLEIVAQLQFKIYFTSHRNIQQF